ncbi:MBL fold metallo-hydrolase [Nocardioides oleivorans]|uniref:MBL fold metallo-hydrolase n=1 Tax=Nocardioides oleivorans TaxID=273676 RepID=A0A4Q2RQ96_9ACTN|nr:MBL fold metallo-hydrolase [Nocardioides oleivorans]RYB91131.1 MBL fold metallo-hydrolase [Nocardioides oleivorans]
MTDPSPDSPPRFTEVAPRVWVAHYDWMHVNITLVGGSDGLLMVDTHGSAAQARVVADDVRRLGAGPLTGLVNTHEHWDHHFGNATMVEQFGEMPIHATGWARDHVEESARNTFAHYEQATDHPRREEILETTLHLPTETFSSAVQLDLGDRAVELIHPGRGHTAGDLVVRIPDADVLLGGDLVEESDPPFIGDDSWPLEWPTTLDLALGLMTDSTVVVPGHGQVVDKAFVQDQRVDLGTIAETIRDLASRGVPESEALAQGEWPWDPDLLVSAVRLGYAHLPRSQKRLPLV